MKEPTSDYSSQQLRHLFYALLIITSASTMVGRILSVESKSGKTAMLSANDRSRWCTIRSLVDHGTYEIDSVIKRKTDWYTIDMVRHKGDDGREHYYSSKPPLLPTLLAAEYWLMKNVLGAGLTDSPFYVTRTMLIVSNVLPLVLYFALLCCLVESLASSDWTKLFIMACATWGTFLTTFAVTLNNHLPAAVSVLIAVYAAIEILHEGNKAIHWFVLAGLFSAFVVANELPGLALFVMLLAAFLWIAPWETAIGFVPAAAVVAIAFFVTTYIGHGSLRPPYAHRGDGDVLASVSAAQREAVLHNEANEEFRNELSAAGIELSVAATLAPTTTSGRWNLFDPATEDRYVVWNTNNGFDIREWDHWYEYEGSYWTPESKKGVDKGEPSKAVYAFHTLLGHRGVFSLTPIWLLSFGGIAIWLTRGERSLQTFALMVLTLTLVCVVFYTVLREEHDRNYGGVSCGFRWLFWFIPLWLICAIPAADKIAASRFGRITAYLMLAVSIVSATYASMNPWSHSWIFDYWSILEWIAY
ncbi:MAG: hypothetical protein CMJ64_18840 [Planctomycetaceae bacterium]|nr:hypothetical protein [Planctomycetaceae bacterium]